MTIPEYGNYTFAVSGVQVEGWHGFPGVSKNLQPDVQFAWESKVMRIHTAQNLAPAVGKGGFKMERNLVTNEQYYAFLVASGWWPNGSSLADGVSNQNFLNHWVDSHEIFDSSTTLTPSKIPAKGTEQQPVRWVSMNDARRYCTYYKRRLVTKYIDPDIFIMFFDQATLNVVVLSRACPSSLINDNFSVCFSSTYFPAFYDFLCFVVYCSRFFTYFFVSVFQETLNGNSQRKAVTLHADIRGVLHGTVAVFHLS